METEAVTHALRWTASGGDSQTTHALRWTASGGDSQTTHAILLTDSTSLLLKVKSGMGSPGFQVFDFEDWIYCPRPGAVKLVS